MLIQKLTTLATFFPALKHTEIIAAELKAAGITADECGVAFAECARLERKQSVTDAMNTDVGFFASVRSGDAGKKVRALARLVVILDAGLTTAIGKTIETSKLKGVASQIVVGNDLSVARAEAARRIKALKRLDDDKEIRFALLLEKQREQQRLEQEKQKAAEAAAAKKKVVEARARLKARVAPSLAEYEGVVLEIASTRVDAPDAIRNLRTAFVVASLDRFIDAAQKLDEAVEEVNANLEKVKETAEQRAAMKREIALFLFKAIRNYAPPPINIIGAIATEAVSLIVDAVENASAQGGLHLPQVNVSDVTRKTLDAVEQGAREQVRSNQSSSTTASVSGVSIKGTLVDAKNKMIKAFDAEMDRLSSSHKLYDKGITRIDNLDPQKKIVMERFPFHSVYTPPTMSSAPDSASRMILAAAQTKSAMTANKEKDLREIYTVLDELQRLCKPIAPVTDDFTFWCKVYVYAKALEARRRTMSKNDVGQLEDGDITYLEKIGLISTKNLRDSEGLPIHYQKSSSELNTVFFLTMLHFCDSRVDPFSAIFQTNGMEKLRDGFLARRKHAQIDAQRAKIFSPDYKALYSRALSMSKASQ